MHECLYPREPPIPVTVGTVKQWWLKYRVSEGSIRLTSAAELEQQYGATIKHYVTEYPSAFKLCAALRARDPPICIDDRIAKDWLKMHSDTVLVHSAGHLEMHCGDRIRGNMPFNSAESLASWLLGYYFPLFLCVWQSPVHCCIFKYSNMFFHFFVDVCVVVSGCFMHLYSFLLASLLRWY